MALSLYCAKCGSKNEFTIKKPEFCGSCGTKYAAASSVLIPTKKTRVIESDENFENEEVSLPNINKIEIDLSIEGATNTKRWVKGEDRQTARRRLMGRPEVGTGIQNVIATNAGQNPEVRRNINPSVNPAQVLAELRKESIGNRNSEEIN